MTANERREREKEQVRKRILEAARELFVEHGYEAVTMRQIAKKIAYTPTAIYFHFKDKEQLIQELCSIDFLALAQDFNRLANVKDPLLRLRMLAQEYVRFGLQFPNHYRLLFMTPHPHRLLDEERLIRRGDPAEDAYAFLRSTVIECIAAGHFRPEHRDPELLAQVFWATVHGVTALYIAHHNDVWIPWRNVEQIAELCATSVLAGLMRDGQKAALKALPAAGGAKRAGGRRGARKKEGKK